jgi:hypothetical protein
MSNIDIREVNHEVYGRCILLANKEIDLAVTLDYGPRIIRFGFKGEENELCDNCTIVVKSEHGDWRQVGGHRLVHSPEDVPRTYIPDNKPVSYSKISGGVSVTQEIEPWTQLVKEMEITIEPEENIVHILHRITNKNAWPVELSVWGITAMAVNGIQIIPLSRKQKGSLPNRALIFWPYAKVNDKRFHLFDNYVVLRQDPSNSESFKLGINNEDGWAAYINHNNLFVKKFEYQEDKSYPDNGASYETYTNNEILEMEILSPLEKLDKGKSHTLKESWKLIKNVSLEEIGSKSIDKIVNNYIL